ncbi:TAXI family TRAP transporter solute-binding subunit [Pseudogracilibacillus auburnensis]|uniref:TAXI family TRAP transporter solute-binding subunit n=1 Tax=Pseudogracilibacillus auburnensis TaxID=1494959 RepID=UPI001A96EFB3|nr:TAXI family TRAP transporter solute-binding subunit [Pseudogracilibacillus auburnensis]MBO1003184.1 TAXI family TRAP transporter solute-binding subunit [Pseudogracilibacillus auburnensis]
MKKNMLIALLLLVGVFMSACGDGASGENGRAEKNNISIGTAPLGSGWYNVSITLSDIWMDNIDGMNVNVLEGGSIGNIRSVNDGTDMHLGWAYTPDLMDAVNKQGAFEEEEISNVQVIGLSYPVYLNFVTSGKNKIEKIDDLLGENIHAGAQGTGSEVALQRLLEEHGLSYEKIEESGGKISFGNYSDAATQLQDGIVDVAVGGGAPDIPAFKEVEALNSIKLIPVEQSYLEPLTELGYRADLPIPKETYKDQNEDVSALAYQSMIIVNSDIPEDQVYEITKFMWENVERIVEDHPARGSYFTPEIAVEGLEQSYFHPGAVKYYKEIGVMD